MLVWQNDCTHNPQPCGFTLYPAGSANPASLAIDVSSKAAIIKGAAFDALKKAYERYPVEVKEGRANSGDNRANVIDGVYQPSSQRDATIGACGASAPGTISHDSDIYYRATMEQAQRALKLNLQTVQDLQGTLTSNSLFKTIGTGIGNNAAHELAHQFLSNLRHMDDDSVNTYNGGSCMGDSAPWNYGLETISWEDATAKALESRLGAGWHILPWDLNQ